MAGKTLIVIVGPAGSGKTDLAVAVAEHFGSPVSGQAFQHKWGLKRYTPRPSSLGGYILAN